MVVNSRLSVPIVPLFPVQWPKPCLNLKTCAQNNLVIHDVPVDGNCLFHAVLHQLDAFSGTVDDLRQMVASYLDSHQDFYVSFVPLIRRLKAGAWGNHVCVAAMANMFSATINVFKATDQTCFVQSVTPLEGESRLEVNIGLTN